MRRLVISLSLLAVIILGYIATQQNWHTEYEMDRTYELNTRVGTRTVLTFHAFRSGGYEHALVNQGRLSSLDLVRQQFIAQYPMPFAPSMGYDKFVFEAGKPGTDTIDIIGCVLCQDELLKPANEQNIGKSRFIVHVK